MARVTENETRTQRKTPGKPGPRQRAEARLERQRQDYHRRQRRQEEARKRKLDDAVRPKRGKSHGPATLADLARSGLDARDAVHMGLIDHGMLATEELTGWNGRTCFEMPYLDLDGNPYPENFARFKFTTGIPSDTIDGKVYTMKQPKYSQRRDTGVRPYLARRIRWRDVLADPSIPVIVTEGEKKAEKACKEGFLTVGLGGVNNIRRDGVLLDELTQLAAGGRKITICFDSDRLKVSKKHKGTAGPARKPSADNPPTTEDGEEGTQNIRKAELTLAAALRAVGARVFVAAIPPDGEEKAGVDDVLVRRGGRKQFQAILDAAVEHTVRTTVTEIRAHFASNDFRHRLIAESIVGDLRHHGRFIHTPEGLLYFDGESKTLLPLDDHKLREARAYLDAKTAVCGADIEWSLTFERLADTAFNDGEQTKVHKLAAWHEDRSVLYIARSASELFEITPTGWRIVDNGAGATADCAGTLIHTRGKLAAVEVDPKRQGRAALDNLIGVPHFIDGVSIKARQSRMLWALYFLALFFPQALPTRPIPLFHGPKGSGKTSGGRALLRSVYGPEAQVCALNPKKPDALESVLVHDAMACLDNVDGNHVEIQNALASASTGGKFPMRTLYTTLGQSEFTVDCFLMVTSRDPKTFARDDLVDRLLYLPVGRREGFISEVEINGTVDANRPKLWRWLLDTLPAIIKALQTGKDGVRHDARMADFARFAIAVGPVIGYPAAEVRAALAAMASEALSFQMEFSPIVGALGLYVDAKAERLAWMLHQKDMTEEKYNAERTDLMKPIAAAKLLAGITAVAPTFPYRDATSFGRLLLAEEAAIRTRFKFASSKGRTGSKAYAVEPLYGFLTYADQKEARKGD